MKGACLSLLHERYLGPMKTDTVSKTKFILIFNLFLCLFIIAWGAWVRLSGSGAGCGEHWPLCNGEVIPLSANWKTYTEYIHRFTTGLFGFTVLLQIFFSHREFPKGHGVRRGSYALLIMTFIESLIGAVLVKRGLVVDNTSAERAFVVGAHLVNTMLLLSTFVHTQFHISYRDTVRRWCSFKGNQKTYLLGAVGLILILLVGAFGAVTALGNTLFPSTDLVSGIASDFNRHSPFLIRLRIYHPILAVVMGIYWIALAAYWRPESEEFIDNVLSHWSHAVYVIILVALSFGFINWLLMAPIWGALVHLILADLVWMSSLGLIYRKLHN